ncbi:sulfurtransferase complex subunit TusD [Moraxella sp. FZLJ2107]|uniref:sulfurtransferase complex subunit TusD n=1 Tax=unclassified Moraxella TaxID=2685852 RepID=UPI0020C85538|nr:MULTISPECIES: sulfurtransferase complex subunit TusD [unclassified Moraxella]UTO05709.1 sulfurtransferase complex subunit TusD [Moraxella sp. FZLJ2107]UTO22445.1 sulfurtransferase complex subunit TusD [Moraxella sp. FZLJ2109]
MTSSKTLILITTNPHSHKAKLALQDAQSRLAKGEHIAVFFYGDGAYTANRLMWQTADVPSIATEWVNLAQSHNLSLPVCVSTALARGITDAENAKRHSLDGDNLLVPFTLVGLSELALLIDDETAVVQY